MKYEALKKQALKSLKVNNFDGGTSLKNPPFAIDDNQLSSCSNMWFKDSCLQTRPGFKGNVKRAVDTTIYGYTGELNYNITDTVVYYNESYHRIATADILTDQYAHYTYVYLIDLLGNITPIGYMTFLRISSDVFYTPINILFYNGKSETGGGIFALVTLENQGDITQRNYQIYEVNEELDEWHRVYDYYVPTIYINGRGNKYETARTESKVSFPASQTLESPNMLNGRFNAYYSSDGFSNSFRLPFNDLANESVVCRIYYTLTDYIEWNISSGSTKDTKTFLSKSVTAYIDRKKGSLYFKVESSDYAIPVMDMHSENNIKITATKEIKEGLPKIVHSTCAVRYNSKLVLSGGKDGNTLYVTSYDNPLYFPKKCAESIGESNSVVTALSLQDGKILAFKPYGIYSLTVKEGSDINKISLLSDNDSIFKNSDTFTCVQIADGIGCGNKRTLAVCDNVNIWQGLDNNIYALTSLSGREIICISENVQTAMPVYNARKTFAVSGEGYYMLFNDRFILVAQVDNIKKPKLFLWSLPDGMSVQSGFYHKAKFHFLCKGKNSKIAYMANIEGDEDSILSYDSKNNIIETKQPIKCSMSTKDFHLSNRHKSKNISNIYILMAAKGECTISINKKQDVKINLGFSNEEYSRQEHKSVGIMPHLYGVDSVGLTISSNQQMSIGEIEIIYRITG